MQNSFRAHFLRLVLSGLEQKPTVTALTCLVCEDAGAGGERKTSINLTVSRAARASLTFMEHYV
jgi:hypothetical protein